jgi:hypothetical protein
MEKMKNQIKAQFFWSIDMLNIRLALYDFSYTSKASFTHNVLILYCPIFVIHLAVAITIRYFR